MIEHFRLDVLNFVLHSALKSGYQINGFGSDSIHNSWAVKYLPLHLDVRVFCYVRLRLFFLHKSTLIIYYPSTQDAFKTSHKGRHLRTNADYTYPADCDSLGDSTAASGFSATSNVAHLRGIITIYARFIVLFTTPLRSLQIYIFSIKLFASDLAFTSSNPVPGLFQLQIPAQRLYFLSSNPIQLSEDLNARFVVAMNVQVEYRFNIDSPNDIDADTVPELLQPDSTSSDIDRLHARITLQRVLDEPDSFLYERWPTCRFKLGLGLLGHVPVMLLLCTLPGSLYAKHPSSRSRAANHNISYYLLTIYWIKVETNMYCGCNQQNDRNFLGPTFDSTYSAILQGNRNLLIPQVHHPRSAVRKLIACL
ncbi:hypothetical protein C8R43DRAFT_1123105 [Mycena crocata]|nr:hypothetical protein C8R43DRAFT_1123102 [Mycena crocata]KAJ7163505.1 hypothetical protein C8R43DRAFT_1123105 [Mycena crocata]